MRCVRLENYVRITRSTHGWIPLERFAHWVHAGESRKQRAAALAAPPQPEQSASSDQRQQPESQEQQQGSSQPAHEDGLVYSEFEPLAWAQNAGRPVKEFPTFDAALDEFFSKVRACSERERLLDLRRSSARSTEIT